MSPNNPSRKRVLPSWMKDVKSTKSQRATNSSNLSMLLGSNNATKRLSSSGGNPTNSEEVDRVSHNSMFVPRNTVLFVMSEIELLETARLILEEDDHSPSSSPRQPSQNNEYQNVDADVVEERQENGEQVTDINDMAGVLDNTSNGFKDPDKSNSEIQTNWSSSHFKQKQTSKRRLDESPCAAADDNDSPDEDAMDVEPSPVIAADPTAGQSTSGLFSVINNYNKDFRLHSSNPKMDTMTNNNNNSTTPSSSSSDIIPTQKKRLKPDLSVLDEIFF